MLLKEVLDDFELSDRQLGAFLEIVLQMLLLGVKDGLDQIGSGRCVPRFRCHLLLALQVDIVDRKVDLRQLRSLIPVLL